MSCLQYLDQATKREIYREQMSEKGYQPKVLTVVFVIRRERRRKVAADPHVT